MTVMHIGTLNRDALETLHQILPKTLTIHMEGDSWEEWGEGICFTTPASVIDYDNPVQRAMIYHPAHIVIEGEDSTNLLTDLATIMSEAPDLLVPMAYYRQRGILACLTPGSDWSEPFFEVTDVPAKRFLARNPGTTVDDNDTNERAWRDRPWLEYLQLREGSPVDGVDGLGR